MRLAGGQRAILAAHGHGPMTEPRIHYRLTGRKWVSDVRMMDERHVSGTEATEIHERTPTVRADAEGWTR